MARIGRKAGKQKKGFKLLDWLIISLNIAFRLYSAFYMIIADCDETFNYWDPLNLLLRSFGKQTWEYSPEYAIRSYAYLLPYYFIAWPIRYLVGAFGALDFNYSYYQFYVLRIVALCGFTSYAEFQLYDASYTQLSPAIANWFMLFTSIAPGMSHASVALLPSSFAMQCNLLALSNILRSFQKNPKSTRHSVYAIIWFLTGGIIGWPFALALGATFGIYTLFSSTSLLKVIGGCAVGLLSILSVIVGIDSYFYSKLVLVPLNIVLYNVFGGEGEGPEIFGVEPLSYYVLNLLLNFNIIVILAYFGVLLVPLLYKKSISINITVPLLIWSIIFFQQPHKEERFLYPIYPLISLNAALVIHKIYALTKNIVPKINKLVYVVFIGLVSSISILRILNLVENYSAPLQTFEIINIQPFIEDRLVNVCIGKEWYHFPNSLFLPDNYRLRFVQSGFDGLLPGDFSESFSTLKQVTSFVPPNMNNLNQFEQDKVVQFSECDYFIDNDEVSDNPQEPKVIVQGETVDKNWELLGCNKLIDPNGNHTGIGRLLYIPRSLRFLVPYNVEYLNFCALKRRST